MREGDESLGDSDPHVEYESHSLNERAERWTMVEHFPFTQFLQNLLLLTVILRNITSDRSVPRVSASLKLGIKRICVKVRHPQLQDYVSSIIICLGFV